MAFLRLFVRPFKGLLEAVARLSQLLAESHVLRFALHDCLVGDQGAEHLAEALQRNEVLLALSLEGNRVTSLHLIDLSQSMNVNVSGDDIHNCYNILQFI